MADKFLDSLDLKKLKEELSMTRLGQMIWEDGVAEGEIRGREALLKHLIKVKLEKGKTVEEITEELEENLETVEKIVKSI